VIHCMQDPDDRGVFQSLPGHEGLVTCVRFIGDDVLASTDDNGIMRCWRNIGAHASLPLLYLANASHEMHAHPNSGSPPPKFKRTRKPFLLYVFMIGSWQLDPQTLPSRFGRTQEAITQASSLTSV